MRARTARVASVYALVTAISAAFGAVQGPRTPIGLAGGAASGALIGIVITIFEIQVRDVWARQLRRFKPYQVALVRFLVYLGVFYLIPAAVAWMIERARPELGIRELVGDRHLALYFAFALAVNLFMAVRRMLGTRNLLALTTGRYRRPREEERIVAFMDLRGSTPLAERLGAARYHDFLNDVFFDVVDAIIEAGATVYQYVGDEIVVTWQAARGLKNADCIAFLFAVEDALAARHDAYLAEYGLAPSLRGALHIGPLMVGEIGDLNRQIVMIGDTMNTTARIEGVCRKMDLDYVASAALLGRIAALPAGVRLKSLGLVPLAGKESELELFALTRG